MLLIIQSSVLSAAFTVAVPLRALVAADTVADVVLACWALVAVHVTHYKVLRLKPGPKPLPLNFVHWFIASITKTMKGVCFWVKFVSKWDKYAFFCWRAFYANDEVVPV